jgi:transcriptional regulator with XRE-family HTH domain
MRMSTHSRTEAEQPVRRKQRAATKQYVSPTLHLLMAELQREEITARIKQARNEAGLTQAEMGELLEVIPRSVQNYEAGRVPWDKIAKIAEITGKTHQWLLHGTDEGTPVATPLDQLHRMETAIGGINSKLDELLGLFGATESAGAAVRGDEDGSVRRLLGFAQRELAEQRRLSQPPGDAAQGSG